MFALGLPQGQMDSLLETGKTDPDNPRIGLKIRGPVMAKTEPIDMADAIASLQDGLQSTSGED